MKLNYKHLRYFQVIAEEGSISKAAQRLHLAPQTIGAQLAQLEESLATPLLRREGREWQVTDSGVVVLRYAKEIFKLGNELGDALKGANLHQPLSLVVGITDAMPKTLVHRLLLPALGLERRINLHCHEGSLDQHTVQLANHSLDLVLADRPLDRQLFSRSQNHLLCASGIAFMAQTSQLPKGPFPACLNGAPFLMPSEHHWLAFALNDWFEQQQIEPDIRGYFDDTALLKTFAKSGLGICAIPALIAPEVAREFDLHTLEVVEEIQERYYAITMSRKIHHPGVQAICEQAQHEGFSFK